jgi:hypothetical protein
VVVYWSVAVHVCGLLDVLGDPSSCFDSEDDLFRSRGDARVVPVDNVVTTIGE